MKNKDTILLQEAYDKLTGRDVESRAQQLLDYLKSREDAQDNVFYWESDKKWWVSNEWLVGGFAGGAQPGDTPLDAAVNLVKYFDRHVGHDSIVGSEVTKSGWPDLESVKAYVMKKHEPEEDEPSDDENF